MIRDLQLDELRLYAEVPATFEVTSRLAITLVEGGLGGITLREEPVRAPYTKDYDAYEEGGPERWPERFDMRSWGLFLSLEDDRVVGGAARAFDAPDLNMLEGRRDLAVLWDLRVHPDVRGRGIGTELLEHATRWSHKRGCQELKIETQNVNVPACRLYAKLGCRLGSINRYGYAQDSALSHEAMLVWYRDL